MADHQDEEHLEDPASIQPISPSEEIVPIKDTETISPNQETKNMEIHKHPHHVTHKKKWGEYFLEFFMLFLAVFLGFLVENFRELRVEKHRGEQYVRLFREDLCKDTAVIQFGIQILKHSITDGDSLRTILQAGRTKSQEDIKKLYQYNVGTLVGFAISFIDRTEAQLKNSGGMRLITNRKVADGIVDYWYAKEILKNIEKDIMELIVKARERSYFIFDYKFYPNDMRPGSQIIIPDNVQLMTNEYNILTEFSNRVNHLKNIITTYIQFLEVQHANADSLIAVIDKEF